ARQDGYPLDRGEGIDAETGAALASGRPGNGFGDRHRNGVGHGNGQRPPGNGHRRTDTANGHRPTDTRQRGLTIVPPAAMGIPLCAELESGRLRRGDIEVYPLRVDIVGSLSVPPSYRRLARELGGRMWATPLLIAVTVTAWGVAVGVGGSR